MLSQSVTRIRNLLALYTILTRVYILTFSMTLPTGIRTNTFAHYDYGSALRNMQAYGRPAAPVYDVALIPTRMPVLIIGGGQDYEAPPHGIRLLLSQLHQPAMFINLTNYAHYDLGFSMYREKDIFQPILKFLEGQTFP